MEAKRAGRAGEDDGGHYCRRSRRTSSAAAAHSRRHQQEDDDGLGCPSSGALSLGSCIIARWWHSPRSHLATATLRCGLALPLFLRVACCTHLGPTSTPRHNRSLLPCSSSRARRPCSSSQKAPQRLALISPTQPAAATHSATAVVPLTATAALAAWAVSKHASWLSSCQLLRQPLAINRKLRAAAAAAALPSSASPLPLQGTSPLACRLAARSTARPLGALSGRSARWRTSPPARFTDPDHRDQQLRQTEATALPREGEAHEARKAEGERTWRPLASTSGGVS